MLDEFAFRQFDDPEYGGTKIPISRHAFMSRVRAFYSARKAMADEFGDRPALVDGYAPFCKHIFMPNFDDRITDGAVPITEQNRHLLRSSYEARSDEELPVLVRYFPRGSVNPPPAKYLDLIRTCVFVCHYGLLFVHVSCFLFMTNPFPNSRFRQTYLCTLSVQSRSNHQRECGNGSTLG